MKSQKVSLNVSIDQNTRSRDTASPLINKILMRLHSRKGLSPVVATVILAGVVLVIGGGIWNYSLGAASLTAETYVNDTLDMLAEMKERFIIEHVRYDSTDDVLKIWIYNYGDVDINIDLYASLNTTTFKESFDNAIVSGETLCVNLNFSTNPLSSQDQVAIKAYSRRQNIEYYTYYVQ